MRRWRAVAALALAVTVGPASFSVPVQMSAGARWEVLKEQVEAGLSGELDQVICRDFLLKLAEAGEPLLATVWLDKIRKSRIDLGSECYEAIIAAHCAVGLTSQAESVLEAHAQELAPVGQKPLGCYAHLLQAYAKEGNLAKVKEYLEIMKSNGAPIELPTYDAAVQALAQGGECDAARRVLEEALRQGVPSRSSFHAALGAFAKESRLADAEGIVKAMRMAEAQPDAETWGWLLVASASSDSRARRRNSYTSPEAIFKAMLEDGVAPHGFVLQALGKAIGAERRYELCRELGLELPEVGRRHRKAAKKLVELKKRPYADGYWQPSEKDDATGEDLVWLGDDYIMDQLWEGPKYWPGQKLFKPDKDCGTRRHRKPDAPLAS